MLTTTDTTVFDLPGEVLETLVPRDDSDKVVVTDQEPPSAPADTSLDAPSDGLGGPQSCSMCGIAFETLQDQRGHLRSDLHRYNLKQKLRGLKPVSEADFERLMGDLDESLSGSDSDESEDEEDDGRQESTLTALLKRQAKLADKKGDAGDKDDEDGARSARHRHKSKSPLVWFSSTVLPEKSYFGLYRAILTEEELRNDDLVGTLRKKQVAPVAAPRLAKDGILPPGAHKGPHVFLCMIGGGHFAAMVVSLAPRSSKSGTTMSREAIVLAHKTFHRYTTRRKQGGSQSANDNSKGNAHSAGSSLRRYNEQALVADVRALLQEWKTLLDTSELLFIRATGTTNRKTIFGPYEGQVLQNKDARIRGFPFNTRRPTQKELMRSFIELTRLKIREIDAADEAKQAEAPAPAPAKAPSPKPAKPKLTEEEEEAIVHTAMLQGFIRRSKLPALLSYLASGGLSADFEFQPREQNHHAPRPLHLAAARSAPVLVRGLLTKAGADPRLANAEGKTPFELAADRPTRDAFRVARSELGEARWPWDEAGVPAAMTKAEADARDERERHEAEAREAQRRQAEMERLRTEGPQVPDSGGRTARGRNAEGGLARALQGAKQDDMRELTPDMRLRLERERRARAAEERLRRMKEGGV